MNNSLGLFPVLNQGRLVQMLQAGSEMRLEAIQNQGFEARPLSFNRNQIGQAIRVETFGNRSHCHWTCSPVFHADPSCGRD